VIDFLYRYWDNVGGEALDAALAAAAKNARFIVSATHDIFSVLFHAFQECGMISVYNTNPYLPKVSIGCDCQGSQFCDRCFVSART